MDSAEVEIVAKKYLDSVYRVAINYAKNVQDAGDAVQNAFLKLIKTDMVFSDEEHIRKWLIKVPINECKSFWRRLNRHSVSSLDELYDNGYELPAASHTEYNTANRARELYRKVADMKNIKKSKTNMIKKGIIAAAVALSIVFCSNLAVYVATGTGWIGRIMVS